MIELPINPSFLENSLIFLQNRVESIPIFAAEATIYNLAEKDLELGIPKIYRSKREYIDLLPNDKIPILAFFYEDGNRVSIGGYDFLCRINLVVWFNSTKFSSFSGLKERLISEVIGALGQSVDNLEIVAVNQEVLSFFDSEDKNALSAPYQGFRISFDYVATADCTTQPYFRGC